MSTPAVLEPIGCLPGASLEETAAIAGLQTRVDCKYVVRVSDIEMLLAGLGPTHAVLETRGRRLRRYETVYYDTATLDAYRAHVQRRRRRFKLRSRLYADTGDAVFEIKLKGLRGQTIKRRMSYSPATHGVVDSDAGGFARDVLERDYGVVLEQSLHPVVALAYERVTLVRAQGGERLTVDLHLSYRADDRPVGGLSPGLAIVETKTCGRAGEGDRLLARLGHRPVRCSKYCVGVALSRPYLPANDFRRLVHRHFDA